MTGHATPDGVDKYHREMAERERRGTEPGFKSQASSNVEAKCQCGAYDRPCTPEECHHQQIADAALEGQFGRAIPNRVWGTCAHCGGDYTLKKDGTMRAHGGVREHGLPFGVNCPGSGKPPGFVPSTDAIPNRVHGHGEPLAPVLSESESDWRGTGRYPHATRNREAEDEWQFTTESGNVFDLPFYRAGYIAGWRAAMTEARGGDWSQESPDV